MKSRTKKNKKLNKKIKNQEKRKKLKKILLFLIIILLLFLFYARFIEPTFLITNEIKIESTTIPDSFHGLKVIHFSDLHYGSTVNKKYLDKLIKEINILKPDIVMFTGDLIEESYEIKNDEITYLTKKLKEINATYGKYAVTGNHDFYNTKFSNILYDSDFLLLNNEYDIIYNSNNESILIYGIDDIIYGNPDISKLSNQTLINTNYKIVMLHEPDYVLNIINNYNVDMIVAGHSHNKQINLPLIKAFWLPPQANKYYEPYYKLGNTEFFISNGLGTSQIKLRAFTPPSINFYRIVKK